MLTAVSDKTPLQTDSIGKYVVWALETEHKHGRDISVHISYASAEECLWEYVMEGWNAELGPFEDCKNPIETYFESNEDTEWYDITQLRIYDHVWIPAQQEL